MATTKRRDRGSGSVYRTKDGLWVAALTLPPDPATGKPRRKVMKARSKQQVMDKLAAAKVALDRSGDLPTSSPTLATWLTYWLDKVAAPRLKPRTLTTYRGYVDRYLVPTIGKVRLDRLTTTHVRRVHDTITARGLSPTTALQAHRILAKALTDAEREGRVTKNVATLLDAPRRAVARRTALDATQAATLLRSVQGAPVAQARWGVALLAGLRQGEALGLTRDAMDLDAGTITVSWQLQRLTWQHGCGERTADAAWPCGRKRGGSCPSRHLPVPADQEAEQVSGGLWLTRPKSRAGWREVPIAPGLDIMLDRATTGREWATHGLVFTRDDGRPVDPSDDHAMWDEALLQAGLPDVVLHSARHTCASLLYQLGVPEHTRMKILGHSSATVTAGYTHVSDMESRDAMARLGALLVPQIEA